MVPEELEERQHLAGVALPTLATGCRVRITDRTAARPSCENGDGADGRFKRLQACALDFFFLHTAVTCERTFQMQDCIASQMSRFLHIFLDVHQRRKSEWISLKLSPNVTPNPVIIPCENDTDAT